jgi:alkylation response protein AidB-like acyl-CoA dehydrogenase
MPLFHTEDQAVLADTVRPFMAEQAPISHMRGLREAKSPTGYSENLWRRFAEMGFTGILIDEGNGGLGLGQVEAGIVLEEIGRNLTPSPFLATAVGAVTALKEGTAAQQDHRPERTALKAERSGNGFRLSGAKSFVINGHVADFLVVAARTAGSLGDENGITLFIVEKEAAGLDTTPERLADASLAARLRFDGVSVDADAVIGEIDGGWIVFSRMLNAVRVGAAAELLGVGAGAMDMTVGYLKGRKQFGQRIGSFQALQHRAAHLYAEMEVARSAVLKAQQLADIGDPRFERAAMVAKAMTGKTTALAVQEGVQMHGGIGMTDEYDVGFFMKRARVLDEMFGDADFHADRLAHLSGY